MACDLHNLFGKLVADIPSETGQEMVLSADSLPELPAELTTPQVSAFKTMREYSGYSHSRIDVVRFEATRRSFRLLALALLSKVFHPVPREAWIHLSDPEAHIRHIVLDYNPTYDRRSLIEGYYQWPDKFAYVPQDVQNYGHDYWQIPNWAKPHFNLTNVDNVMVTEQHWQGRDVVRCAGSEYGTILFANMLLDVGRSDETRTEFAIETEIGFGGVELSSAEVELAVVSELGE